MRQTRTRLFVEALEDRCVPAGLPALNSLVGARASLYLDFNGHAETNWSTSDFPNKTFNVSIPAFDLDGNTASLSDIEAAVVRQIWERVAEDFAPFQVNVTTVEPSDFGNGRAERVAVGGTWTWLGGTREYSGYSSVGSFTDAYPNTVFAFSSYIRGFFPNNDDFAATVATTISHEAGHAFGLQHQRTFNADGSLKEDYSTGTATWTPIMGYNLSTDRTTWHNGTTLTSTTLQDDMAVLAGSPNNFGYRPDDYSATSFGASTRLYQDGNSLFQAGIIERNGDLDYFHFVTTGGAVSLTVDAAARGANLLPNLTLLAEGREGLITPIARVSGSGGTIARTLSAGTYYVIVDGDGVGYGNVGQYTVRGTVPSAGGAKSLGGWVSRVASVTLGDGRQELFGIGGDNAVWHKWQTSVGGSWTDWYSLGGDAKEIAVIQNANGLVQLFALARDGSLRTIRQSFTVDWGRVWMNLGGFGKQLSVQRNSDGRLEVFVIGGDDRVWHIWQVAANGSWNTWWGFLGAPDGTLARQIAAGKNADGRLELFLLDAQGRVFHRWQTGNGWSGWGTGLQGGGFKQVVVANNADGRMELFVIGADNRAYHRWQVVPSGGWNARWEFLGGDALESLQVGRNANGLLQVVAVGAFRRVRTLRQTSALDWGQAWSDLGGWASSLCVSATGDGRLEFFGINWDNSVWRMRQNQANGIFV